MTFYIDQISYLRSSHVQNLKLYLNIIKPNIIMMCKNCNCDIFDKCSIVGYMPIGFCCENCYLYDEHMTCLNSKSKFLNREGVGTERLKEIKLKSASIEGEMLKVVLVQNDDKKKTLYIDLKKYLES